MLCTSCNHPIAEDRLAVIPDTTRCIRCATQLEVPPPPITTPVSPNSRERITIDTRIPVHFYIPRTKKWSPLYQYKVDRFCSEFGVSRTTLAPYYKQGYIFCIIDHGTLGKEVVAVSKTGHGPTRDRHVLKSV